MQGPEGPGSRLRQAGAVTEARQRGQWRRAVSFTDILLVVAAVMVTWLGTAAHGRSRAAAQGRAWRRERAEMLARMGDMQDVASRARIRSAQVTQATAEWSEGYKQGCSDMIKAMAALRGGTVAGQHDADQAVSAN